MIIKNYIEDPIKYATLSLARHGLMNWMPDALYIKCMYRANLGKKLDLRKPKTFNEKLQWLKLYDRKPEYTMMVDKYAVKAYIAEKIGEQYVVPVVGGPWDSTEDIDFDALPDQFVLKCTHDSGGNVVCRDKNMMDQTAAKEKLARYLKRNYYSRSREWPYKNVKPRIFAEQYMEDSQVKELRDYKFFCFDGEVKALFIASERQSANTETKFDFFDMDFRHLDVRNGHPNADQLPERPKCFEEMRRLAGVLSKGIPHVRVDFYEVDGNVYFGEMTFYHWSGMVPFEPEEWDRTFGEWIHLPEIDGN